MLDNKQKVEAARAAYEQSSASVGKNAEETKKLKTELDKAESAFKSSEGTVRANNTSVQDYTIKLNNAKGALGEMESNLKTINAQIAVQSSAWNELQTKLSEVSKKVISAGKELATVGKNLSLGVTVPIVGIATAAVNSGNEFEAQMSRVSAISETTGAGLESLKNQALQLGADTAFSAKEAAEGMENLASAGFNVTEIAAAMPGMLDLAASSGEGLASSADIAASTLRGFGLAAGEAGRVADVLAKNAAQTNAAVADTGEAMKYIAPLAQNAGWSMESVTAAIGEMADSGIKGSQAGTTLRGVINQLASPSKIAAGLMKDMGFSAYDSNGKMKSLSQIVDALKTSTLGMTKEQKDYNISTIFGSEALSGLQVLINQGSGNLNKMTLSLQNSDGAAAKMAKTMQGNTKGAIEQMKGSIETAAIKSQEALAPSITNIANKIQELANAFSKLSPQMQGGIAKFALVAAAVGPVIFIVGKLITGIGAIAGAFGTISGAIAVVTAGATAATPEIATLAAVFGAISLPLIGIIAGIAALVAGFVILWNNCEGFRNFWIGLWAGLQSTFQVALTAIQQVFSSVWEYISPTIMSGLQFVQAFWNSVWPQIQQIFTDVWNVMKAILTPIIAYIDFYIRTTVAALQTVWTIGWTSIKDIFKLIWDLIVGILKTAWTIISGIIKTGLDLITGIFQIFKDFFSGNWSALWNDVKSLFSNIWNDISGIFTGITKNISDIFKNLATDALQWGKDLIMGIVDGIKNAASAVGDAVKGVAQDIRKFLHFSVPDEGPLADFESWMPDFMGGLAQGIESSKYKVANAIRGLSTDISVGINPRMAQPAYSYALASQPASPTTAQPFVYSPTFNSPKPLGYAEINRINRQDAQRISLIMRRSK
jgi:TP901 family phage tail tape measure protein